MFEEGETPLDRGGGKNIHCSGPSYDIWNRFYSPSTYDTVVEKSRKVTENTHVFVDYILFENFNQNGVIRISNPAGDTKVLVSSSVFYKSSSHENGGRIYLSLSKSGAGSCVQYKICSYDAKIPYRNVLGSFI